MSWFEIEMNVPNEMRESVVNRLFELGAQGVTEDEPRLAKVRVQAYFASEHREAVPIALDEYLDELSRIYPTHGPIESEVRGIEDRSWADEYKRYYQAQKLSRSFFLKPAWDDSVEVPNGYIPIVMDPGQAFGTGLHPTTQLCLKLLERALSFYPRREDLRLLDVGTGSGILAIAALKLGIGNVAGVDNDPIAVEAALENLDLNDARAVEISERNLASFPEPFQIVLSNILLETHRELVQEYARLVVRGGQLVLSGLLAHQKAEIQELMSIHGFMLEASETRQEWFAGLFTHVSQDLR